MFWSKQVVLLHLCQHAFVDQAFVSEPDYNYYDFHLSDN